MSVTYISITPHDPIIARDSLPFGAGLRMKSLDWPYPSVLAGSVRTALGKINCSDFKDPKIVQALKEVSVFGPLPLIGDQLYFPSPRDLLVDGSDEKHPKTYAIRPVVMQAGEGCDLPSFRLQPAMLPSQADGEFKPTAPAPFWSYERMVSWLTNPGNRLFDAPAVPKKPEGVSSVGLTFPQKESRFHVKMAESSGSAEDGMLFETVGLDFALQPNGLTGSIRIAARLEAENEFGQTIPALWGCNTLGGERRVSIWETKNEGAQCWECPKKIRDALAGKKRIRMVLATPAYFSNGWLPDWIDKESLTGHPPYAPEGIEITLISACVEHWKPLSGWSMETAGDRKPGPKPLRRLVPAGSVYFFECRTEGDAQNLATRLWLKPVSDESEDNHERSDGFGLALWGVWDYEKNNSVTE